MISPQPVTVPVAAASTAPPSPPAECAYADLLSRIRESRGENLALAAALVLDEFGEDVRDALAERLYEAVRHG